MTALMTGFYRRIPFLEIGAAALFLGTLLATMTAKAIEPTTELTVLVELGIGDDPSVFLHRPTDLCWSRDGSAFLLNTGQSSILRFSNSWEVVGEFGSKGEAPGQFLMPNALFAIDAEVWVISPWKATIYSQDGDYLRDLRLTEQISAPTVLRNHMYGVSRGTPRLGVQLDSTNGTIVHDFGPALRMKRDFEDIVRFSSWAPLGFRKDDSYPALLDKFDGQVYLIKPDGEPGPVIDLRLGQGVTQPSAMQFKPAVADACIDDDGGLLVVSYPTVGAPPVLHQYDSSWTKRRRLTIPAHSHPSQVRIAPTGELCLLSEGDGTLVIAEIPPWDR